MSVPQIQANSCRGMALNSPTNVCSDPVKAMAFDKEMVMPYLIFRFSIVAHFLSLLYGDSARIGLASLKVGAGLKKLVSEDTNLDINILCRSGCG